MAGLFKPCAVDGCKRNAHNVARGHRGFCRSHYFRFRVYGDPTSRRALNGAGVEFIREHVNYSGSDCLLWPFGHQSSGYAVCEKNEYAHRRMCQEVHGPAPSKRHYAIHSCGKGREGCVNPRHLRWGLPKENSADMVVHGTVIRGEKSSNAKLTVDQVRQIRIMADDMIHEKIANIFGVKKATVQNIVSRKNWAWLA